MSNRILTSHAGSLPRPDDLISLNSRRASGEFADEEGYARELRAAVRDVVARQRDTGIDLVNDGEYGHSMGQRYDYWAKLDTLAKGAELATSQLWR